MTKKLLSSGEGYTTHYWCMKCKLWHSHDYFCAIDVDSFAWCKWPDEWEHLDVKTDSVMGRGNPTPQIPASALDTKPVE